MTVIHAANPRLDVNTKDNPPSIFCVLIFPLPTPAFLEEVSLPSVYCISRGQFCGAYVGPTLSLFIT